MAAARCSAARPWTARSVASANGAEPSGDGVDAQQEVVHDRVADDRQLEDVVARLRPPRTASLGDEVAIAARTTAVISPRRRGAAWRSETRLMRSSPKRICGFITPAEASTSPSARSRGGRRWWSSRRRWRRPGARSWKPGQIAMTLPRRGRRRSPCSRPRERRLERLHDVRGRRSRPFSAHSRSSASNRRREVAGRRGQVRRHDLDVVEADDRVDGEVAGRHPCARPGGGPGSPAARRRRRRRGVRGAAEAAAVGRGPRVGRSRPRRRPRGEVARPTTRCRAWGTSPSAADLAATADAAAAADRVEVDA